MSKAGRLTYVGMLVDSLILFPGFLVAAAEAEQ
jgi:hypothetical protein